MVVSRQFTPTTNHHPLSVQTNGQLRVLGQVEVDHTPTPNMGYPETTPQNPTQGILKTALGIFSNPISEYYLTPHFKVWLRPPSQGESHPNLR
uniref:Uncharacterized protein n=1 Tax=Cannabis sativa TaxID=3483 RepID=A0A803NLS0_CANSA